MQKLKFPRVAAKSDKRGPEGDLTPKGHRQPPRVFPSLRSPPKGLQPHASADGPAGSTYGGPCRGARTRGQPARRPSFPRAQGRRGRLMAIGSVLAAPIPQTPWHVQVGLPGARAAGMGKQIPPLPGGHGVTGVLGRTPELSYCSPRSGLAPRVSANSSVRENRPPSLGNSPKTRTGAGRRPAEDDPSEAEEMCMSFSPRARGKERISSP